MDVATAVDFFCKHEMKLQDTREPVYAENPLSLIRSVALWSGWVSDLKFIHKPTLVIKPKEPFRGRYQNLD